MYKVLFILLVLFLVNGQFTFAQNAKLDWADSSATSSNYSNALSITESNGFIYQVGFYAQSIDLDPSSSSALEISNGGNDIYIRKLDDNESLIWGLSLGGDLDETVSDINVDANGDIVITGSFRDTVDFDPGTGIFELTTQTKALFILKLDSNGNFIWASATNVTAFNVRADISFDNSNNIILSGGYQDSMDFDFGPSVDMRYASSFIAGFVAKYTPAGSYLWAVELQGANSGVLSTDILSNNEIIAVGSFNGTVDFDPGVGILNESTSGTEDAFVWRLDSSGNLVWVKFIKSDQSVRLNSVKIGIQDTLHLAGWFSDSVDFDPNSGEEILVSYESNTGSVYTNNVFVAKWTGDGDYVWAKGIIGNQEGESFRVDIDSDQNIYVAGEFEGTTDFDPSMGVFNLTSSNNEDIFLLKLSRNGNFVWAKHVSENLFAGTDVEVDDNDNVYLMGSFSGTVDLDPGFDIHNAATNAASYFLIKLSPCIPSATTDTVVICDGNPYTWINGFTYNSNNTSAKMVFEAANGCDSIVSLNLTFNNPTASNDVITACNSYTWIDGNTYTSSNNTAQWTFTNVQGCDSIINLDLTLIPSDTVVDVITSCSPYTWIDGNTYSSSNNTAQMMYTNVNGCDSIVQLDLTVGTPTSGTDVVSSCESFSWIDGNTYTSSNNTATFTATNSLGCDSVITLDLTIFPATSGTDVITACDSYTWIDGTTYTSSNNTAQETILNVFGCDSTVTLDLTINSSTTYTDVIDACDSYTWIDGNSYTASNNTAQWIVTNTQGCDSIITLDLTINTASANVTNLDPQLVSAVGATSYQWLDCLNGYTALPGESNSSFIATSNGEYAVVIEENGCLDTSACFIINNVGLTDITSQNWKLYPNPTDDNVTFEFYEIPLNTTVEVTNSLGQAISKQAIDAQKMGLTLGENSGVYFVRLITEESTIIIPVLKK